VGDTAEERSKVDQVAADAAAVYRHATRHGVITSLDAVGAELGLSIHDVIAAVSRLGQLQLLRVDDTMSNRLLPVNPEVAATLLVSPIERAIYQRTELADQLRGHIDAVAAPQAGSIDCLDGVAEMRGLFKLAAEVCRDELLVLRPSCDDEDLLDELLAPCFGVLDRDVPVRVVGSHRSRADFGSRARTKRMVEDGAMVRTLSQVPKAAVVFDRSIAVIFSLPAPGGSPTARRVRDDNVVRFLVDLFDQLWDGAKPYESDELGYAGAVDDLHQAVARLMAQGYTDEVVARRLGMSVRTCRRHIAALLDSLDSVSRFQAGVQAAQRFAIDNAADRT
jgi:DNA-binding CsgD family transcriptional regulator